MEAAPGKVQGTQRGADGQEVAEEQVARGLELIQGAEDVAGGAAGGASPRLGQGRDVYVCSREGQVRGEQQSDHGGHPF